jgi:hypothetical protein
MGSRVRGSFSSFAFSDAILLACGIQFEWNIALPRNESAWFYRFALRQGMVMSVEILIEGERHG